MFCPKGKKRAGQTPGAGLWGVGWGAPTVYEYTGRVLSRVSNLLKEGRAIVLLDVLHSVTLKIPPAVFRLKLVSFSEK